jgi:hypothetical protein
MTLARLSPREHALLTNALPLIERIARPPEARN